MAASAAPLRARVDRAVDAVTRQLHEAVWAREYARFIDDYLDGDLWEGHSKTLRPTLVHRMDVARVLGPALDRLIETGVAVEGLSVAEMAAAATRHGVTVALPDNYADLRLSIAPDRPEPIVAAAMGVARGAG